MGSHSDRQKIGDLGENTCTRCALIRMGLHMRSRFMNWRQVSSVFSLDSEFSSCLATEDRQTHHCLLED